MLPEVEYVYKQQDGQAVRLDDVKRRFPEKDRSVLRKNLQTAIKHGHLYQPERGWYARKSATEVLIFLRPYSDYINKYLHDEDIAPIVRMRDVLYKQLAMLDELIQTAMRGDTPKVKLSIDYLVPNLKGKHKLKSPEEVDEDA